MRCEKCQKEISKIIGANWEESEWLKLMNYFEHELTEGEITNATYESMANSVMTFKPHEEG